MSNGKQRLFKKGRIVELEVHELAFGGKGIAKVPTDSGVFNVFIPNTIPGQVVKAKIITCKSRYAEAALLEILKASPLETEIPFQGIPGAPYATLPLEKQIEYKRQNALDLFSRIGRISQPEELLEEFISSPLPWHYRNKMEYSFCHIIYDTNDNLTKDLFGLGFKHRGMWWAVENLDKDSGLFDAEVENKLHLIRDYCEASGLRAWHPPQRVGFFRYLVVRKSFVQDSLLIGFVTTENDLEKFDLNAFRDFVLSLWGDRVGGLIHVAYDGEGDYVKVMEGKTTLLHGKPKLEESLLGLNFEVSLQSFFQPNPKAAEKLYSRVLEYAGSEADSGKIVLDLFCGTGTITQLLANQGANKVVGVDIVKEAIDDAIKNAQRNGCENVEFYALDARDFLLKYPEYKNNISCVVMDPPRAGVSESALDLVCSLDADRIVYVSCNPATQSRDALYLSERGYSLKRITLVDQFPHTSHLESIMLFERN